MRVALALVLTFTTAGFFRLAISTNMLVPKGPFSVLRANVNER